MALRKRTNAYWDRRSTERVALLERQSEPYIRKVNGIYADAQRDMIQQMKAVYSGYYTSQGWDKEKLNSIAPTGDILVPGDSRFGTSDFLVMKYQAKNDGLGNPVSTASGFPWVSISQTAALAASANISSKHHLITEMEWLTLAHNIASVASNWSGNAVGSGYIYRGHTDNVPANALEASANDADGYYGTGNTSGDQRRTLTLTNGEVIWDLSGNVWEWTSGTIAGGQQPGLTGESAYAWKEWNDANLQLGGLDPKTIPSYGNAAAAGWNGGTNGIGRLYSNRGETGLRAFLRGGDWGSGSIAGVFALYLRNAPGSSSAYLGFRVAVSL